MKLKFATALFVMLIACSVTAPPAPAQVKVTATPTSNNIAWPAYALSASLFNIYRAPCTAAITAGICPLASEGTFALLGSTLSSPYSDISAVSGQAYSYYITAVCTGTSCGNNPSGAPYQGESPASNHVGVITLFAPMLPPAPTGVTITPIAQAIIDPTETHISADSLTCYFCTPFPAEIHATVDRVSAR